MNDYAKLYYNKFTRRKENNTISRINKKILITVIIPVFNTEKYVGDCLDSVLQQTIPMESMEVILVNDASTDGSYKTIEEYVNNFPGIITLVQNAKNMGAGYSRNIGLEYARGEYVCFIDSDDFIDKNAFKFAINKMKSENVEQLFYSYQYFPIHKNGRNQLNPSSNLFSLNRTIFDYEYSTYPELLHALGVSNKIFKRSFLNGLKFPEQRFEDAHFSLQAISRSKAVYVTNQITYFYRKRNDDSNPSAQDTIFNQKSGYIDHVKLNLFIDSLKYSYPYLSYSIDWLNIKTWFPFAHRIFFARTPKMNKQELATLFGSARDIFRSIDSNNYYTKHLDKRSRYMLSAYKKNSLFTAKISYITNVLLFELRRILTKNSLISISVLRTKKPGLTINKIKILIELISCWIEKNYLSISAKKQKNKQSGDVWLFCERGDDAQDNAYHLFRYIRENHSHINAYYVIDLKSSSKQLQKVLSLGNVVDYRSKDHKKYFITATHLISSNARGYIEPWRLSVTKLVFGKFYKKKKYIFLQHGITFNNQRHMLGVESDSGSFDLFITGARAEFDTVNATYGYKSGVVVFTGFPRFDALRKSNRKQIQQILFAPTWRSYEMQSSWSSMTEGRLIKDELFLKSRYYIEIQKLINHVGLGEILNDYDLKFVFFPHHEASQYAKYFHSSSDRVNIITRKDVTLQKLLINSDLFITDYSSTLFDFALMEKPAIYYQFDKSAYYTKHYKKGYFNFATDAFGPVVTDTESLVKELKKIAKKGLNTDMEDIYRNRKQEFFQIDLQNNCKRVFEAICNL